MGNKIGGRRKASVEERYTRPQGLYEHRDIDQKKLRKLILDAKLAPCYPGADEASEEFEECPICFLYYPSLNRSKCCSKGICTECFLQMKPTQTTRPTQCPFCKTPNYAVEYRGVKTKEERSIELVEEQKVIEAQLRMRQQALKDEEEKLKRKQRRCSSSRIVAPTTEVEYRDICSTSFSGSQCTEQGTESCSSEPSCSTQAGMRPFHSWHNCDDSVDMNLEEMMVMEAIRRSIQDRKSEKRLRRKKIVRCMETEQGNLGNPICGSYFPVMEAPPCERQAYLPAAPLETPHPGAPPCERQAYLPAAPLGTPHPGAPPCERQAYLPAAPLGTPHPGALPCERQAYLSAAPLQTPHPCAPPCERQAYLPAAPLGTPHLGGYSCAVAALAEHQPPSMDFSYMAGTGSSTFPVFDIARRPCSMSGGSMCAMENSSLDSWSGIPPSCSREVVREEGECSTDHWSEGAEAGTSYAGSDIVADPATMQPLPFPEHFAMAPSHFRPGSIEEQMMFSMAVSQAEAHAHHGRTHAQGLAWM